MSRFSAVLLVLGVGAMVACANTCLSDDLDYTVLRVRYQNRISDFSFHVLVEEAKTLGDLLDLSRKLLASRESDIAAIKESKLDRTINVEMYADDERKQFVFKNAAIRNAYTKKARADKDRLETLEKSIVTRSVPAIRATIDESMAFEKNDDLERALETLNRWDSALRFKKLLADGMYRPAFRLQGFGIASIGEIDTAAGDIAIVCVQVTGKSAFLARLVNREDPSDRELVIVSGVDTRGFTDGKVPSGVRAIFAVTGTRTYSTADGGTNTCFVIQPVSEKKLLGKE